MWQPEMSFELPLLIMIGPMMPVPLQCSADHISADATKRSRVHGLPGLSLLLLVVDFKLRLSRTRAKGAKVPPPKNYVFVAQCSANSQYSGNSVQ